MAEKKKAYQRFEELTKRAIAPTADEAGHDRSTGMESLQAEAISIRLSPEVRRALDEQAAADNTTPSEIVQRALRRYLEIP